MHTARDIHEGLLIGIAVAREFFAVLPDNVKEQMRPLMEELERSTKEWAAVPRVVKHRKSKAG